MNPEDREVMVMALNVLKGCLAHTCTILEYECAISRVEERLQAKSRAEELAERGFVKPPYPTAADDLGERLQAGEKVAYPEGDVVGPCICGSWPGGKCCKCPQADEKEEPVAWIQSNHLTMIKQNSSFLARCADHQLHPDYVPLYAHGRKGNG